ncbi:MAG: class I SAM-dependent methyltransferase, partial [Acidimicrobiales bacterium]
MTADNSRSWDQFSAAHQATSGYSTEVAHYGPGIGNESDLRLLGDLKGKRVLELGCGGAQCSIAFAKQGATAIGVDFSANQLAFARQLVEQEAVRVELRHGDLADLAFLRADTIDVAFSSYALGYVEDLGRVFRQVHRVLRVGGALVFSLSHPAYDIIEDSPADHAPAVRRSYFDRSPMDYVADGVPFTQYHHSFSDLYMQLLRASYRVDLVAEPEPGPGADLSPEWREAFRWVPRTLIMRA